MIDGSDFFSKDVSPSNAAIGQPRFSRWCNPTPAMEHKSPAAERLPWALSGRWVHDENWPGVEGLL